MTGRDQSWGALSDLPGNPLMWVLIISELAVFGAILVAFAVTRSLYPSEFQAGQAALSVPLGGLNTLVLLTSGWLAALAVLDGQRRMPARCRHHLALAGLLGLVFLAVKLVEWQADLDSGFGLETNAFWTLYFLTTGFHAAHVGLGLAILAIVARHPSPDNVETGAAFWHMVDLIWILLFPVLYLTRGG